MAHISAVATAADLDRCLVVRVFTQRAQHGVAAGLGLRQQFHGAIQADVENAVGARDGFEFSVMADVRTEATDVDDDLFAGLRVCAYFARKREQL